MRRTFDEGQVFAVAGGSGIKRFFLVTDAKAGAATLGTMMLRITAFWAKFRPSILCFAVSHFFVEVSVIIPSVVALKYARFFVQSNVCEHSLRLPEWSTLLANIRLAWKNCSSLFVWNVSNEMKAPIRLTPGGRRCRKHRDRPRNDPEVKVDGVAFAVGGDCDAAVVAGIGQPRAPNFEPLAALLEVPPRVVSKKVAVESPESLGFQSGNDVAGEGGVGAFDDVDDAAHRRDDYRSEPANKV